MASSYYAKGTLKFSPSCFKSTTMKKNTKPTTTQHNTAKRVSVIIILFLVMGVLRAGAITYTSSGTGGDWDNAATWGGAGVPQATDDVIIAHGTTVVVNGKHACKAITI